MSTHRCEHIFPWNLLGGIKLKYYVINVCVCARLHVCVCLWKFVGVRSDAVNNGFCAKDYISSTFETTNSLTSAKSYNNLTYAIYTCSHIFAYTNKTAIPFTLAISKPRYSIRPRLTINALISEHIETHEVCYRLRFSLRAEYVVAINKYWSRHRQVSLLVDRINKESSLPSLSVVVPCECTYTVWHTLADTFYILWGCRMSCKCIKIPTNRWL